ncbi:hypothetical protein ACFSKM_25090 [Ancylobacter dichloromethanicus]
MTIATDPAKLDARPPRDAAGRPIRRFGAGRADSRPAGLFRADTAGAPPDHAPPA